MTEDLWFQLGIFLSIVFLFFGAVVAAARWEKRPIQPFYVPEPGTEYLPSDEAKAAHRVAERLGYVSGGLCHDGKSTLYRIRYDYWLPPDHTSFVVVGSGTVAKIPVNGIWILSRLRDDRVLCTTNETGEQDISGVEEQQTWPKRGLAELVELHAHRLGGVEIEPFPETSPMLGYFDIRKRKAEALVARGYAYYLDDERTAWRYTLKGAIVFYFVGVWIRPARRLLRSVGLVRE